MSNACNWNVWFFTGIHNVHGILMLKMHAYLFSRFSSWFVWLFRMRNAVLRNLSEKACTFWATNLELSYFTRILQKRVLRITRKTFGQLWNWNITQSMDRCIVVHWKRKSNGPVCAQTKHAKLSGVFSQYDSPNSASLSNSTPDPLPVSTATPHRPQPVLTAATHQPELQS